LREAASARAGWIRSLTLLGIDLGYFSTAKVQEMLIVLQEQVFLSAVSPPVPGIFDPPKKE
jgi:hypothetical protein